MNANTTESIIVLGIKPVHGISNEAYHQRITIEGMTCHQKQQTLVRCGFCEGEIQQKSLRQHHQSKKCHTAQKNHPNNQLVMDYCIPTTPAIFDKKHTILLNMDNIEEVQCPHNKCPYSTKKGTLCKDTSVLNIQMI
jgi:hypothetical protein